MLSTLDYGMPWKERLLLLNNGVACGVFRTPLHTPSSLSSSHRATANDELSTSTTPHDGDDGEEWVYHYVALSPDAVYCLVRSGKADPLVIDRHVSLPFSLDSSFKDAHLPPSVPPSTFACEMNTHLTRFVPSAYKNFVARTLAFRNTHANAIPYICERFVDNDNHSPTDRESLVDLEDNADVLKGWTQLPLTMVHPPQGLHDNSASPTPSSFYPYSHPLSTPSSDLSPSPAPLPQGHVYVCPLQKRIVVECTVESHDTHDVYARKYATPYLSPSLPPSLISTLYPGGVSPTNSPPTATSTSSPTSSSNHKRVLIHVPPLRAPTLMSHIMHIEENDGNDIGHQRGHHSHNSPPFKPSPLSSQSPSSSTPSSYTSSTSSSSPSRLSLPYSTILYTSPSSRSTSLSHSLLRSLSVELPLLRNLAVYPSTACIVESIDNHTFCLSGLKQKNQEMEMGLQVEAWVAPRLDSAGSSTSSSIPCSSPLIPMSMISPTLVTLCGPLFSIYFTSSPKSSPLTVHESFLQADINIDLALADDGGFSHNLPPKRENENVTEGKTSIGDAIRLYRWHAARLMSYRTHLESFSKESLLPKLLHCRVPSPANQYMHESAFRDDNWDNEDEGDVISMNTADGGRLTAFRYIPQPTSSVSGNSLASSSTPTRELPRYASARGVFPQSNSLNASSSSLSSFRPKAMISVSLVTQSVNVLLPDAQSFDLPLADCLSNSYYNSSTTPHLKSFIPPSSTPPIPHFVHRYVVELMSFMQWASLPAHLRFQKLEHDRSLKTIASAAALRTQRHLLLQGIRKGNLDPKTGAQLSQALSQMLYDGQIGSVERLGEDINRVNANGPNLKVSRDVGNGENSPNHSNSNNSLDAYIAGKEAMKRNKAFLDRCGYKQETSHLERLAQGTEQKYPTW